MKTTVKSNEIGRALKLCVGTIDPKDPIRSNIMMVAENDQLRISATNSQYSIELVCSSDNSEEGTAVVDGKMAYNIISKSQGDCVITSDEKSMVIKSNGRTKLPIIMDDLSMLDDVKGNCVTFDSVAFKNAICKIDYAISDDQSRMILTGAHIVTDGEKAILTALDGFRLSQVTIPCSGDSIDIIVPSQILQTICDAIVTGQLTIMSNGIHISVNGEGFSINATTLSGAYIDTDRIIPHDFTTKCLVNTAELKRLAESATVASGNTNLVKLDINNDKISMTSNSPEAEFAGDVGAMIDGNGLVVAFNLKYLIQAINHVNTEQCELCLNSPVAPMVVLTRSDGCVPDLNLILPVRVLT